MKVYILRHTYTIIETNELQSDLLDIYKTHEAAMTDSGIESWKTCHCWPGDKWWYATDPEPSETMSGSCFSIIEREVKE